MAISPLFATSSGTSGTSSAAAGGDKIQSTKEQFLQLLIAQLKNQDPMSPADSDQMTNQMMQMGQLEQLFNLNSTMNEYNSLQKGSQIAQYSGMVGRTALAVGNTFQVSDANKGMLNFYVAGNPAETTINVFDQYKNLLRQFPVEVAGAGDHTVNFDGLNNNGQPLPNGYYSFEVDSRDAEGARVDAKTYSTGQVSSIRIENGSPIFQLGVTDLSTQDIVRIY